MAEHYRSLTAYHGVVKFDALCVQMGCGNRLLKSHTGPHLTSMRQCQCFRADDRHTSKESGLWKIVVHAGGTRNIALPGRIGIKAREKNIAFSAGAPQHRRLNMAVKERRVHYQSGSSPLEEQVNWLQQISDDDLLDLYQGVLHGLCKAVEEVRAAKLEFRFSAKEASEFRLNAANEYLIERNAKCNEVCAEMKRRNLGPPSPPAAV